LALSDVGALAYRKSVVNLVNILEDAANRARLELTGSALTLSILMQHHSVMVFADPERLAQLFDNLLNNSRKYTDVSGTIIITLDSAAGCATIHIKDSQLGVSEDERKKLFDRLYRMEGSRNRASGGGGLGLAPSAAILSRLMKRP
jgi:two-component system sensor histidine kinase BaeS